MSLTDLSIDPSMEGIDHIRISIASRSALGRLLANEALTPFVYTSKIINPKTDPFLSLEAFWAWARTRYSDEVDNTFGVNAKRVTMRSFWVDNPNFRLVVCEALEQKIEQFPHLKELLSANKLELVRYEIEDGDVLINTEQAWFMDHLNKIRKRLSCRTTKPTSS